MEKEMTIEHAVFQERERCLAKARYFLEFEKPNPIFGTTHSPETRSVVAEAARWIAEEIKSGI